MMWVGSAPPAALEPDKDAEAGVRAATAGANMVVGSGVDTWRRVPESGMKLFLGVSA
jgi:hypothetical protein